MAKKEICEFCKKEIQDEKQEEYIEVKFKMIITHTVEILVHEDCKKKLEAETEEKLEEVMAELPELRGTSKQIDFAKNIISNHVRDMLWTQSVYKIKRNVINKEAKPQEYALLTRHIEMMERILKLTPLHDNSVFWIDYRWHLSDVLIKEVKDYDMYNNFNNCIQALVEIEKERRSATACPEGKENAESVVIKISHETEKLYLTYKKDDSFIYFCKEHCGSWDGDAWAFNLPYNTLENFAAAMGAELLKKGYPVQYPTMEIRDRSVHGEYTPISARWVELCYKDNNITGISLHFNNDYLYSKAKTIRGAQWAGGSHAMIIPVDRYADALDFASQHNFALADDVERLKEAMENITETVYVVTELQEPESVEKTEKVKKMTDEELMEALTI